MRDFPGGPAVKNLPANAGHVDSWIRFLDREDSACPGATKPADNNC